jgi:hypothetical protein
MARIVLLVLLLANLAVFAWVAGYLGGSDEGREPERLKTQLQPERLKVTKNGKQDLPSIVCRRIGPLAAADAEGLGKTLAAAGITVERVSLDEPSSYWVFIAAVEGNPADNEIAALKKAGFKEFFVVTDEGVNRNAISLGSFRSEEGAREKVALLVNNGIKAAKILAKPASSTGKLQLNVRGTAETLDKALAGNAADAVECSKQ